MFSLDKSARTNLASAAVCCAAMTDNLRVIMNYKPGQKTSAPSFLQAVAASLANGDLTFRDEFAARRFFDMFNLLQQSAASLTFNERLALAGLSDEADPQEAA